MQPPFDFRFITNELLCMQLNEASKHYKELVRQEARSPEDWSDEDSAKIDLVFNYVLALVNELQNRDWDAAEREADIDAAIAAVEDGEHEFDQDDFDTELCMESGAGGVQEHVGAGAGAGGASAGATAGAAAGAAASSFTPPGPQKKWPTMEELIVMPPEHQIHYCCNWCEKPAVEGSFYPGKWCTWICAMRDSIV